MLDRAQWNIGLIQEQSGIQIFTDGSNVGGGSGATVFCRKLGLELYFRLKDKCSVYQADIIAILNRQCKDRLTAGLGQDQFKVSYWLH